MYPLPDFNFIPQENLSGPYEEPAAIHTAVQAIARLDESARKRVLAAVLAYFNAMEEKP